METTEYSLPALISRAERYCATAEHCLSEVQFKLRQWGCQPEDIANVLDHLVQAGYINQQRYANAFVHDKVAYQGWGRNKLKAGLFAKFVDEAIIDNALQTIDDADYQKALKRALSQKKGATREQLLRFLLQRGFTYDEIESIT